MPPVPRTLPLSPTAFAAVSGLCLGLATPSLPGGVFVLLAGAAAARGVTGEPVRDSLRGLLAGLWWFAISLAWVAPALAARGDPPSYAAVLAATQAAAVTPPWLLASLLVRRGVDRALAWGLAWLVAAEPVALWAPIPSTPALLLSGTAAFVWPAALGGAPLLSALAMGVGAGLPRPAAGVTLGAWALVGALWIEQPDVGRTVRVAVLQPGGHAAEVGVDAHDARRGEALLALGREARDDGAVLLVGPEGGWPLPQEHPETATAFRGLPPTLVGGRRARLPPVNRVLALEGGAVVGAFDKRRLVPVLERSWAGLGADRWTEGDAPRSLDLAGLRVGPLVCYEAGFPDALREAVAAGADLLAVPSNDADLVGGNGALWNLALARLAAVTTGRPVLRASTNGISAVIAPSGRSLAELSAGPEPVRAVVDVVVPRPGRAGVVVGPWLSGLGLLLGLGLATRPPARPWRRRRG